MIECEYCGDDMSTYGRELEDTEGWKYCCESCKDAAEAEELEDE